jgi:hypothetical protein
LREMYPGVRHLLSKWYRWKTGCEWLGVFGSYR